jgi:hypothetical protein
MAVLDIIGFRVYFMAVLDIIRISDYLPDNVCTSKSALI